MTAFGGSFIQAPNPIDFDKVFVEFTRLGETGNVAVLVTIATLFLVYIVLIVYVRRADKRDENKVSFISNFMQSVLEIYVFLHYE